MTLEQIQKEAPKEIRSAENARELDAVRLKYLGRKDGALTAILRSLKDRSPEERRTMGKQANDLRTNLEELLEARLHELKEAELKRSAFDITAPGSPISVGHLHPLTQVAHEVKTIFRSMSFDIVSGPEIEMERYNFDALNIPEDHPARDLWDTFWLQSPKTNAEEKQDFARREDSRLLLRTHTSPVQIHYMETHQPPFQIIVPGRVFRYEATDASHEINFYQVEGLVVGKDVSLAHFKHIIETFFKRLFTRSVQIRLRPSYFPFVEPGLEVDISCVKCAGEGCSICQKTGWLEIMGAGMVHPHVFQHAHYNPDELQGFAFGLGLDRIAMLKYNIPDIRLFYSGDYRFIKQF